MKNVRRRTSVFLSLVLLCASAGATASAASGDSTGAKTRTTQTTWTTYLYQGPSYRYSVIDEVPQAATIEVGRCANDWCDVTFGHRSGYIRANVVARGDLAKPGDGVLAQPAAAVSPAAPNGPCFEANQTGGNGGNAMNVFCRK